MAIKLSELRNYAGRTTKLAGMSLSEVRNKRLQAAFLSHSHKDRAYAEGVQAWLEELGWTVYIDWQDDEMTDETDRETAEKLQEKIKSCYWFLYLATKNSAESRWCPWEIGYADSERGKDKILIIPTAEEDGTTHGNEYLQLYQRITHDYFEREIKLFHVGEDTCRGHSLSMLNRGSI